jgi:ABC-type phosphate transport system ATPase subunit
LSGRAATPHYYCKNLALAFKLVLNLKSGEISPASLDFKSSEKIEELLKELQRNYTIVAVSHSLSQAQRIADQIFVMKEGTIVTTSGSSEFERKKLVDDLLEEIF